MSKILAQIGNSVVYPNTAAAATLAHPAGAPLVVIACAGTGSAFASYTYDGNAVNNLGGGASGDKWVRIGWYADTTPGNKSVVASAAAGSSMSVYAWSLGFVYGAGAVSFEVVAAATGNDNAPTVDATSLNGELVFNAVAHTGATASWTVGAGQTKDGCYVADTGKYVGGYSYESAVGTPTTMSWALDTVGVWSAVAIAVKRGGGGSQVIWL